MTTRPLRYILSIQPVVSLLLAALLLLLAAFLWFFPQQKRGLEVRQQELARAVASRVEGYLEAGRIQTRTIVSFAEQTSSPVAAIQQLLDAELANTVSLNSVMLTDSKGVILAASVVKGGTVRAADLIGLDLSSTPVFRQQQNLPGEAWSETFLSLSTGGVSAGFAVPGKKYVAIGEVSLTGISSFLGEIASRSDLCMLVTDQKGQLVAGHNWRGVGRHSSLLDIPLVQKADEERVSASGSFIVDGEQLYGTILPIRSINWNILVAQPTTTLYRPVKTVVIILSAAFLLALATGVASAHLMSHRISLLLDAINRSAAVVSENKPVRSWPDSNISEFAELTANLRQMAELQQRQRAEIARSEKRYRGLVENSPVGIFRSDLEGGLLYVSPGFARQHGFGRVEELFAYQQQLTTGWKSPEQFRQQTKELPYRGAPQDLLVNLQLHDGRERHFFITLYWDMAFGSLCGFVIDVTAEKRGVDELARQRNMLLSVIEGVPQAIFWKDLGHRYLGCNRLFAHYSGAKSIEEIIAKNDLELPWPTAETEQYKLEDSQIMESGTSILHLIRQKHLADGSVIWVDVSKHPLRHADGEIYGVIGIMSDITAKKQQEEELQNYQNQLEEEVAIRTEELSFARDSALAAVRAKSEFLANMSHEIRTPMNAVNGMIYLARQTELTARQAGYLDKAAAAAGSLLQIINDILDLSKIEAGKMELGKTEFMLQELIESVAGIITPLGREKGLELQFNIAANLPPCLVGDRTRLQQVLINLLGNAVKFTDKGSVRLDVSGKVRGAGGPVQLRFDVTDTGIGIEPEQLKRLFAPFTQLDGSSTRKYGGTGLGLSICKHLVELMGGHIMVDSEPAVGSRFSFTIEVETCQGVAATEQQKSRLCQQVRLDRYRILLAEDNEFNRLIAVELLESVGGELLVAENGQQALDTLQQEKVDLILMDLQMPVMDGLEATKIIKDNPAWSDIPIIAMTAHAMEQHQKQCLEAGMADFITKPVDPEQFYETVARHLLLEPSLSPCPPAPSEYDRLPATLPGINILTGLRRMNFNQDLYLRMLQRFVKENGEAAREIAELLAEGDQAGAIRKAHSMKSAAGSLGAEQLMADAASLESLLSQPDTARAELQLESFQATLKGVIAPLEATFTGEAAASEQEQAPSHRLDRDELLRRCQGVSTLLDSDMGEAFSQLEQLLPHLAADSRFEAVRGGLVECMERFDVEGIRTLLERVENEESI